MFCVSIALVTKLATLSGFSLYFPMVVFYCSNSTREYGTFIYTGPWLPTACLRGACKTDSSLLDLVRFATGLRSLMALLAIPPLFPLIRTAVRSSSSPEGLPELILLTVSLDRIYSTLAFQLGSL